MNGRAVELALLLVIVVATEVVGLIQLRWGRRHSYPYFVRLGKRMCYMAPVLLVLGLIGLAISLRK